MNPLSGNFANGVVYYTIVFKISALYFFGPNTGDCLFRKSEPQSYNHNVVEGPWFL